MEVYEITGFQTGVSRAGVNFLQPSDSFQNIEDGYVHRQVLKSRKGIAPFGNQLSDGSRVMGIFKWEKVAANASTVETLAITKDYLYSFNTTTNQWDQIPMAGNAPATFGISSDEFYVSGVGYFDSAFADRFVFCGKGLSNIYFYDGTDVKVWNNATDNPDFSDFARSLSKAEYVLHYNGRINFYAPTLGSVFEPNLFLYSGVQDASGNGDKFDVAGAGTLGPDSNGFLKGVIEFGDNVIMNMTDSTYIVEKTTDQFNPYFVRQIPSVLGTDAPFSTVAWDQEARSMGKNGILATDRRVSKRVDDKIPYFTRDDIGPAEFELTYGGFDRDESQFLWSYRSSDAPDGAGTQDLVLVNNYEEDSWSTYNLQASVFGDTISGVNLSWDDIDETIDPSWSQWDTTTELWDKIGIGSETQKTLMGTDLGYVYEMNSGFNDQSELITGVTKGSTTVITLTNDFVVGDKVAISGITDMVELNNFDPADPDADFIPYTVTAVTSTTITVNVDSTEFTTWSSGGGVVTKVIDFVAETIPFNPYRDAGRKVYVSQIEFLINTGSGFLTIDILADEDLSPVKPSILAKTNNISKRKEWVATTVNHEADFLTIRMRQNNPVLDLKIFSIRIHARPGGLTSG